MKRCVLIMPPVTAPMAYQTLSRSFPNMLATCGVNIIELKYGEQSDQEFDIALYSWYAGNPVRPTAKRHIEITVDCDLPPTEGIERVYPSEAWRNYMWAKHHPAQIGSYFGTVIPNWVDPKLWPLCPVPDNNYILYAGRLWPNKTGLLPYIIKALPNEHFVIAGEGDRSYLEAPNVTFLGLVEQQRLAILMGNARAVLCPTAYCEPFGLTAVEAGLTGALVIASDAGSFHETIPPESIKINPCAIDDWIDAVNNSKIQNLEKRLARRKWHEQNHSPEIIGPRYANLLQNPPRIQVIPFGPYGAIAGTLK